MAVEPTVMLNDDNRTQALSHKAHNIQVGGRATELRAGREDKTLVSLNTGCFYRLD